MISHRRRSYRPRKRAGRQGQDWQTRPQLPHQSYISRPYDSHTQSQRHGVHQSLNTTSFPLETQQSCVGPSANGQNLQGGYPHHGRQNPSGNHGHAGRRSWSVLKNNHYEIIESRKDMMCHNCKRRHPPELCRGPLDHRGLLNCCGYCGHKHLIDDCAQLKMLDQLSQGIWKQYIIYDSRRGLAPFATRERYDRSNFHGGPHREVLNPKMARLWESQVLAYDAAAGRSLYWRRFEWNGDTLQPTADLYDRLPSDPTIPQYLRNTGPPSNVTPKTPSFAGSSHMSAGYLNTWNCREYDLVYDPYWLLFESGPRIPPDTDQSINEAQVRLNWMTGQPVSSFQTRLDWPEPMDIDD